MVSKDDTSVTTTHSLTESTPKGKRFSRDPKAFRSGKDEEELEITEVRQVLHQDLRKILNSDNSVNEKLATLKTTDVSKDTSTNDVLLDAFTNTQKYALA